VIARAASPFHPAFYVRVEGLPVAMLVWTEHRFRHFGGQLAAGLRCASLGDHRPSLDRVGEVQRAAAPNSARPCG
jgi:hypothetical protein